MVFEKYIEKALLEGISQRTSLTELPKVAEEKIRQQASEFGVKVTVFKGKEFFLANKNPIGVLSGRAPAEYREGEDVFAIIFSLEEVTADDCKDNHSIGGYHKY